MMRRLFSFLAVVSLIVSIASGLLLIMSYVRSVQFEFIHASARWEVVLFQGVVRLDNLPQVQLERNQNWALYKQLASDAEGQTTQMAQAIEGGADADPATRAAANAEYARLLAQFQGNFKRMQALANPPPGAGGVTYSSHTASLWPLILAGLPLPMFWKMLKRRKVDLIIRRQANSLCTECGYDLRAASADRCPECGTTVPDSAAKIYVKEAGPTERTRFQ